MEQKANEKEMMRDAVVQLIQKKLKEMDKYVKKAKKLDKATFGCISYGTEVELGWLSCFEKGLKSLMEDIIKL
ncbi:MAG: hypothetical protein IJ057_10285 [Bacteroidales bacterium]|nr:hypothetical protein [Bacteroidales bacterium]